MTVKGVQKIHLEAGPNMTPLVDVVMVILIFLMLAGTFGGTEHYLASTLPISLNGNGPHPPFEETQLDIRVDGGMNPTTPNRWMARFGDLTSSSPPDLKAALTQRRASYLNNSLPADKIQVIINPNQFVKWESLVSIYQAVLEAGYTRIAFSQAH